jgi:hypothetical protein
MWIVRLALRPYTFVVMSILILIMGGLAIVRTPTPTNGDLAKVCGSGVCGLILSIRWVRRHNDDANNLISLVISVPAGDKNPINL